jgi:hypothetical protein
MTFVAAAAIAGSAVIGAVSSKKASGAQKEAAAASDATQRYMYDKTREDNQPFRDAGVLANNKLARLMLNNQFDRRFTKQDMEADPVYQSGLQFGLDEGRKGIDRQSAANGSFLSGATLKALTRFGNDYGSTKANDAYNRFNTDMANQYNRYAGLSGAGQQATNQINAAGQNMANNISESQIGAGNARASGYVGQANALTSALGTGLNAYQNNQLINSMTPKAPINYNGGSR